MATPLDISEEVSPGDYRKVLQNFLDQFEAWRISHGWCTDVYFFVAQLSATFHWNKNGRLDSLYREGYTGAMELDIPGDRTPAQMAQDLREIRGRVLRFTLDCPKYLSLEKANEFLVTAGLAPYGPALPVTNRYTISVTGMLDTGLTSEQLQRKLEKYLKRLGVTNPDVYIQVPRDRYDRSGAPGVVPQSETVRLLPNPSRHY